MTDNIQKESEDYANSKGYRSDKEQYTTTPWTEWNISQAAYLAGRKKTMEENERLERLLYEQWKLIYCHVHCLSNHLPYTEAWQQFKKDNGL